MDVGDNVRAVLLPVLEHAGVEDGVGDLAGQVVDGVADEGGVVDLVLGHEALAEAVAPVAGLAEGALDVEVVHVVGNLVHELHGDGGVARADLVAHVDAVAVHAGDGEGEEVAAPLEAELLLDELGIVAKAAGGDDDGLAGDLVLLAVLVLGGDAADGAVLALDQAGGGALEHELDAQLLGALGHALGHRGGSARAGLGAVLGWTTCQVYSPSE